MASLVHFESVYVIWATDDDVAVIRRYVVLSTR